MGDVGIPCAACNTVGPAGKTCPNPHCRPPSCPRCGATPWHHRAICQDVMAGKKIVAKGCGAHGTKAGRTDG